NHAQAGRLPHYPEPGLFISWALANGVDLPEALADAVRAAGAVIQDWRHLIERQKAQLAEKDARLDALEAERLAKSSASDQPPQRAAAERPLRPKEQQSLLKLCLGMAMAAYGYRPGTGNTHATGKIVAALAGFGIQIDNDTVLRWLREA